MEASSRQYYHAVSSTAQAARTLDLPATLLLHVVVLHLTGWRNAEGRARNGAGRRVDNGDSVASTLSHRLVQLHVVLVAGRRRVERIRSGGEEERRSGLNLLLQRRALRRARRKGAAVRGGGRMNRLELQDPSVKRKAQVGMRVDIRRPQSRG